MDEADVTDDPLIGTQLAGYRIEAPLGRGGMGVVYRAEQLRLGRKVALKLLAPELVENEGFRVRFEHESRLAAAIDHPHIIPLYEAGEAEGLLFITMRFVEGTDLKALLAREGRMDLRRSITIVGQLAGALDAAHARGLVHRDVKPANVLVASGAGPESSDHCYLTDFGLTKDTSSALELTATGQFLGTIDYVAPEQIQGTPPDGAADLYSLGCVFYECLTGRPPFQRGTDVAVMWAHLQDDAPSAREHRPDLAPGIDLVIAKAMSKSPADRYPSCSAFVAAARVELEGGPPTTPAAADAPAGGLTRPAARPARAGAGPTAASPAPAGATRLAAAPAGAAATTAARASPRPPAAKAGRRSRGRRLGVAAVVGLALIVVLAGALGTLAGRSAGDRSAPAGGSLAAAGPLRLALPAGWRYARPPGRIAGLTLLNPAAIGPTTLEGRAGLAVGQIAQPGPGLLPDGLVRRLGSHDSMPSDALQLRGAQALKFTGLPLEGAPGHATLYVVPTTAGVMGLACEAAPDAGAFLARCERAVGRLRLTGAKPLDVRPDAAYARSLAVTLAGLAAAHQSGRLLLARARTARAQVTAADRLAAADRRFARRLGRLRPPPVARAANAAIAAAAASPASASIRLSAAIRSGDRRTYRAAVAAFAPAERRLAQAVSTLALLGYATGR